MPDVLMRSPSRSARARRGAFTGAVASFIAHAAGAMQATRRLTLAAGRWRADQTKAHDASKTRLDDPRRRMRQLRAQPVEEDIDELDLRLVHGAVKMREQRLAGEDRILAQAQNLEELRLLELETHGLTADRRGLGNAVDHEIADADHRWVRGRGHGVSGEPLARPFARLHRLDLAVARRARGGKILQQAP